MSVYTDLALDRSHEDHPWDTYLDELEARGITLEPLEIVRTCAERGWGSMASCWVLRHHLKISLADAKILTGTLCEEHGLQEIYEAACRARDPLYPHGKDHPTRVLGWGEPEEVLAAKLTFPLLHTIRNFLMDFPQWADKIEANGGAGLCIDIAADLVSYVAEHHPESSVVHGDAEGGMTPEVWVCRTSESHVELPDIYPVVPAQRDGFAGCHTVACFPVLPGRKTFIYVDLTARQYGSNLPCPIIWEGLPPTYLRKGG